MKKCLFFIISCLILSACEETKIINANCGNYDMEIIMSKDGERINAVINGNSAVLNIALSASGARYVGNFNDAPITLWNKGDDWTLYLGDEKAIYCTVK